DARGAAYRAQPVALVEPIAHASLGGQIALHVITQAGHHRPAATAVADGGQAVVGVVAVAMVPPRGDHVPQVVQGVVLVAGAGSAVHRRLHRRQPVQPVVAHGPVATLILAGGAVADRGHVAVGIVVVAVVQELGAAIGIQTAVGQAADVAGQGVDDAVAVGELLHRPVGVVADAG